MIRFLALTLALSASAHAESDPLTLASKVPVGVLDAKGVVIGIEETQRGSVTTTTAVAYARKKLKKSKFILPKLEIDTASEDPDAEAKAAAAKESFEAALARSGVVELDGLSGNITGRFRVMDWGLTVYLENDQVLARVGDTTNIKALPVVKDFAKLGGK